MTDAGPPEALHVLVVTGDPPQGAPQGPYPLVDAFDGDGWSVELVQVSDLSGRCDPPTLEAHGGPLHGDVAFVRSGPAHELAATLEASGIPVVNRVVPRWYAQQKWLTHLALAAAGVPQVPTTLHPRGSAPATWPAPHVVKGLDGSYGRDVELAHEDLATAATSHLAQPFVTTTPAHDWRVLVAGGEVYAHERRSAPPGDWRSNVARGATVDRAPLPAGAGELARRATAALGLDYAGVDLIVHDGRLEVLEVNANPGWAGLFGLWGDALHEAYRAAARSRLAAVGQGGPRPSWVPPALP